MSNVSLHSGKSVYYDAYRPAYPQETLAWLNGKLELKEKVIADIGCGTGIFTRQLSPFAQTVHAVEPNGDMFQTCVEQTRSFTNIQTVQADAEHTGLAAGSIDVITVATAFHWFHTDAFRTECLRILKPGGSVVILVNSPGSNNAVDVKLMRGLCAEVGLEFPDPLYLPLINLQPVYAFFQASRFTCHRANNDMGLTRQEFIGRYLSMHYAPREHEPLFEPFLCGLNRIFDEYADGEKIRIENKTVSFCGVLC